MDVEPLLHRLQQRRLHFGRGGVDFVQQHDVAKQRAGDEAHLAKGRQIARPTQTWCAWGVRGASMDAWQGPSSSQGGFGLLYHPEPLGDQAAGALG